MDESGFRARLAREGYDAGQVYDLPGGQTRETHAHDFDVAAFVMEGEITLTRAEGPATYRAGDCFTMTADRKSVV
jgi:quercetin dioxygenase-like cupin family protein